MMKKRKNVQFIAAAALTAALGNKSVFICNSNGRRYSDSTGQQSDPE